MTKRRLVLLILAALAGLAVGLTEEFKASAYELDF